MGKYLIHGNYVGPGVKGLLREGGSSRVKAVEHLITSLGGTIDAFYYAFGDNDFYVILDMPDQASVAAASLAVNASGAASVKTAVLMTPEEVDQAIKKSPNYRAPGQ